MAKGVVLFFVMWSTVEIFLSGNCPHLSCILQGSMWGKARFTCQGWCSCSSSLFHGWGKLDVYGSVGHFWVWAPRQWHDYLEVYAHPDFEKSKDMTSGSPSSFFSEETLLNLKTMQFVTRSYEVVACDHPNLFCPPQSQLLFCLVTKSDSLGLLWVMGQTYK